MRVAELMAQACIRWNKGGFAVEDATDEAARRYATVDGAAVVLLHPVRGRRFSGRREICKKCKQGRPRQGQKRPLAFDVLPDTGPRAPQERGAKGMGGGEAGIASGRT